VNCILQGDVGHFLLQCLSAFLSTSGVGGLTGSQWRSMCVCNALLIDATVGPTRTELTLRGSRKHLEDMLGFVALLHGPTATRQVPENKSQFETCLAEIRGSLGREACGPCGALGEMCVYWVKCVCVW
jgi:hypothetical protein